MKEALQRLGFYSGEEDMEYSSYAGDTESAVKSWQATIGTLENGMMTEELLAKLLGEEMPGTRIGEGLTNSDSVASSEKVKELCFLMYHQCTIFVMFKSRSCDLRRPSL